MLKKVCLLSASIILISLFLSCLSVGSKNTGDNTHSGGSSRTTARYEETSMQEQNEKGHWVSGPLGGNFVIIGVSGRLSRQDEEIEAAKIDAARKIAFYNGIQGSVEIFTTAGTGGWFDFSANSEIILNYDQNFEQYKESLVFDEKKDVFRGSGIVFVRFTYNNISSNVTNYVPEKSSGRPNWVNSRNLPEFDGYITAVGHAGKRERARDTVHASCESAIAMLIASAGTQVSVSDSAYATNHSVTSGSSAHQKSEGRLNNFQILAFWIDPSNGAVSTLAIARVSK